jgi:hypothetical protein
MTLADTRHYHHPHPTSLFPYFFNTHLIVSSMLPSDVPCVCVRMSMSACRPVHLCSVTASDSASASLTRDPRSPSCHSLSLSLPHSHSVTPQPPISTIYRTHSKAAMGGERGSARAGAAAVAPAAAAAGARLSEAQRERVQDDIVKSIINKNIDLHAIGVDARYVIVPSQDMYKDSCCIWHTCMHNVCLFMCITRWH